MIKQDWPEDIYKGKDSAIEKVDGIEIYRGLRVRMGVHTGQPKSEEDPVTGRMDYFGPMVNRSARVEGTAHGGQIVISGDVYDIIQTSVESEDIDNIEVQDMGSHRLKGLQTDTQLYQILPSSLTKRIFPKYGEKSEIEESPQSNLQCEMDKLAKENEELKEKMEIMEGEVKEAMQKAEALSQWLEDMQSQLPDSLAKQFLKNSKNIGLLLKSQSKMLISLDKTKKITKKSSKQLIITRKDLEESEKRCQDLEQQLRTCKLELTKLYETHTTLIDELNDDGDSFISKTLGRFKRTKSNKKFNRTTKPSSLSELFNASIDDSITKPSIDIETKESKNEIQDIQLPDIPNKKSSRRKKRTKHAKPNE